MTEQVAEPRKSRRAGGRAARQALRAAPLAEDIRPVRAGMPGGSYKPVGDNDLCLVYDTALKLLAEVGLNEAPESGVELLTKAGADLGADGRLRFPSRLVEDMLAKANRDLTLHARDPERSLHPGGYRVHYGTAGAAVHVVDPLTREYRESTAIDLYNCARIVDGLEHIHFFQRTLVARDITDPRDLDLNSLYACIAGTTKHIGVSFTEAGNVQPALQMLHMVAGSEEAWRARPFVSNSNCFVVPPMKFATESCQVLEECVKGGMPVLLLSAGQAGATAPAALPGALAQATAECLAGLVYVNALKPCAPAIFGTWPFVSDLRTGAMSGGSGEQALLTAACAQMGRFLDLPTGAAAGIADAKLPDMQAGYEQAISNVMAGLAGLNMVYESAGMHASLLGFCLESLIIGNDLLGQCMRCVRGVEITPETLSFDTIKEVCLNGPGHYLGSEQTLELMQRDYVYPIVGDRFSPKEWIERDKPDLIENANKRVREIVKSTSPNIIEPLIDQNIRAAFDIKISRKAMRLS